jgi:hypothetical protein
MVAVVIRDGTKHLICRKHRGTLYENIYVTAADTSSNTR